MKVRGLFDRVINEVHADYGQYLSANADIVPNKIFEQAVIKIQQKREVKMTQEEKQSVKRFKKDDGIAAAEAQGVVHESNWAKAVVEQNDLEEAARANPSQYRSLKHLSVTSNIVERLFSRAKIIFAPHRRHMSPYHLELLLLLRMNKDLWTPQTVQEIIGTPNWRRAAVGEDDEEEAETD
jgi:hypothetical protein